MSWILLLLYLVPRCTLTSFPFKQSSFRLDCFLLDPSLLLHQPQCSSSPQCNKMSKTIIVDRRLVLIQFRVAKKFQTVFYTKLLRKKVAYCRQHAINITSRKTNLQSIGSQILLAPNNETYRLEKYSQLMVGSFYSISDMRLEKLGYWQSKQDTALGTTSRSPLSGCKQINR